MPESSNEQIAYSSRHLDEDFDAKYAEEYDSGGALLIGSLIHAYLEKHQFGDSLDENRFQELWEIGFFEEEFKTPPCSR